VRRFCRYVVCRFVALLSFSFILTTLMTTPSSWICFAFAVLYSHRFPAARICYYHYLVCYSAFVSFRFHPMLKLPFARSITRDRRDGSEDPLRDLTNPLTTNHHDGHCLAMSKNPWVRLTLFTGGRACSAHSGLLFGLTCAFFCHPHLHFASETRIITH